MRQESVGYQEPPRMNRNGSLILLFCCHQTYVLYRVSHNPYLLLLAFILSESFSVISCSAYLLIRSDISLISIFVRIGIMAKMVKVWAYRYTHTCVVSVKRLISCLFNTVDSHFPTLTNQCLYCGITCRCS